MSATNSVARQAIRAVALTLGFYALALGVAFTFLTLIILDIFNGGGVTITLLVGGSFAAGVILWSIFPRRAPFTAPGPRLLEESQPELFKVIREVARETEQDMPVEVYLVPEVQAGVAEHGAWLGLGGTRRMIIGLPLLQLLTISEFRAVLAHEFGHYHQGDTRFGAWIWRTRESIERTLDNFDRMVIMRNALLTVPFRMYGRMFLRVTNAVNRRQEFSADSLAARLVGATPVATSLKKIIGGSAAWSSYLNGEFGPAIGCGARIPLLRGFKRFMEAASIQQFVAELTKVELQDTETYDDYSHPPTAERLNRLHGIPAFASENNTRSAISLMTNVAEVEEAIVSILVQPKLLAKAKPVKLEELVDGVYMPMWREVLDGECLLLQGLTPAQFPKFAKDPITVLRDNHAKNDITHFSPETVDQVLFDAGRVLLLSLMARGWTLDARMGEPVRLTNANLEVRPFDVIPRLAREQVSSEEWLEVCRAADIADMDLEREHSRLRERQVAAEVESPGVADSQGG